MSPAELENYNKEVTARTGGGCIMQQYNGWRHLYDMIVLWGCRHTSHTEITDHLLYSSNVGHWDILERMLQTKICTCMYSTQKD
jgi:hypothetical protein